MRDSRRLNDSSLAESDLTVEVVDESHSLTQDHRCHVYLDLVDEPCSYVRRPVMVAPVVARFSATTSVLAPAVWKKSLSGWAVSPVN